MNSPKVAVSLGFILTLSLVLTACGGGGSTPPPGSPTIQTTSLPPGGVNAAYGVNGQGVLLSATGGTGAYTWSISSGNLPPGLTLNAQGLISGTPTTAGKYSFTVRVTDTAGASATEPLSINVVSGAPTIQTVLLPQGAVNVPYLVGGNPVTLSATGGTGAYTWSIASGSLPPGLTLNASQGVISGTPTTVGNYLFTVQVTDAANLSSTKALSIYIEGAVLITPTVLPTGAANVPYSFQLTATGGLAPYTWCVVESGGACDNGAGTLPPGLTLSSAGVISGHSHHRRHADNFHCASEGQRDIARHSGNRQFDVQYHHHVHRDRFPAVGQHQRSL